MGGVNFLPEQVTPSVFSFPTMNYFVDMTLFSFIEFTYRMTLLKMTTGTGRTGYHNQDRSNTVSYTHLDVYKRQESYKISLLIVASMIAPLIYCPQRSSSSIKKAAPGYPPK